jgi:mannose-6-phosphate isomerase-like protein (cupin superfamily)
MKTQKRVPKEYQHTSPAGAEVRLLMNNHFGGMAHCTLKAGTISKAVRHKTVSEFWHVLSGEGAIWRKLNDEESITPLTPGVSIDIPLGTHFQYRSHGVSSIFRCT